MYLEQITMPAVEPVSLQELKDHLRIDQSEEDELLTSLIKTARQYLETRLSMSFISSVWRYRPKDLPPRQRGEGRPIKLPLFPILGVAQIKFYLEDGTTALADLADMEVLSAVRPPFITNVSLPHSLQSRHGLEVTFTAGYGENVEDVPGRMRLAITTLAAHFYHEREQGSACSLAELPATVSLLMMDMKELRLI